MSRNLRIYSPNDVLTFGKNKDIQLSEIYHFQPDHIEWLILNIDNFAIDLEAFEKLPKPTPYDSGYVKDYEARQKIIRSGVSFLDKHRARTNIDATLDVSTIKERFNNGIQVPKEFAFKFSENAILENNRKIENFSKISRLRY